MATVVITGCSSGIGLETALAFARRGDLVYATMREPARGAALRQRCDAEGLAIKVRRLDVTDGEAVDQLVDAVLDEAGGIDVLVNNAGVGMLGSIEEMDESVARLMFETNYWGAFRMVRAVLPHLRRQGSGVIVNVSSIGARRPGSAGLAVYGATKHLLSHLAECLTLELAGTGVRAVAVEPLFFATDVYRTRAPIDPASPYAELLTTIDDTVATLLAAGADPAIAADAIVTLVEDPSWPVCVVVDENGLLRD